MSEIVDIVKLPNGDEFHPCDAGLDEILDVALSTMHCVRLLFVAGRYTTLEIHGHTYRIFEV